MTIESAVSETFSAFSEDQCLGQGTLVEVALLARRFLDDNPHRRALILQNRTCTLVDLDLSGDETLLALKAEHFVLPRKEAPTSINDGPLTAEITLLPRHWEWLAKQPTNPSAVLRRLIDEARRDPQQRSIDLIRHHQDLAYRFCQALCGDLPNYEDALRGLFARDRSAFARHLSAWPVDLAERARALAEPIWEHVAAEPFATQPVTTEPSKTDQLTTKRIG